MKYYKILNPFTKRWIKTNSKNGKKALYYYLTRLIELRGGNKLSDLFDDNNINTEDVNINLNNFVF